MRLETMPANTAHRVVNLKNAEYADCLMKLKSRASEAGQAKIKTGEASAKTNRFLSDITAAKKLDSDILQISAPRVKRPDGGKVAKQPAHQ